MILLKFQKMYMKFRTFWDVGGMGTYRALGPPLRFAQRSMMNMTSFKYQEIKGNISQSCSCQNEEVRFMFHLNSDTSLSHHDLFNVRII